MSVYFAFDARDLEKEKVKEILELATHHPGNQKVELKVITIAGEETYETNVTVDAYDPELIREAKALLGQDAVKVEL